MSPTQHCIGHVVPSSCKFPQIIHQFANTENKNLLVVIKATSYMERIATQ